MVGQAGLNVRRLAAAALLLLAACGPLHVGAAPATPQSIALVTKDLPAGMIVCGLSGDVDQFLAQAPSGNSYATQLQQSWTALKQNGAQKGYVRVFAGSKDQCSSAFTAQSLTGIRWAASMVVEFKNPKAATTAYGAASSANSEIELAPGAEQGASTGLGQNSLTFGDTGGGLSLFYATWQGGRFLVVLLTLNVPETTARQAARAVNSRIH